MDNCIWTPGLARPHVAAVTRIQHIRVPSQEAVASCRHLLHLRKTSNRTPDLPTGVAVLMIRARPHVAVVLPVQHLRVQSMEAVPSCRHLLHLCKASEGTAGLPTAVPALRVGICTMKRLTMRVPGIARPQ